MLNDKKILAIAMIAFVCGITAYSAAGTSIQDVSELITNFTANVTGQPAIMHFVTFEAGSNVTFDQDTVNHTITISAQAGDVAQSNYFDEVFVNKISKNTSSEIVLNSSFISTIPSIYIFGYGGNTYLKLDDNTGLLAWDDGINSAYHYSDEYNAEMQYYTLDSVTDVTTKPSYSSVSYYNYSTNDYSELKTTGKQVVLTSADAYGSKSMTVDNNKITIEQLAGTDNYLKVNVSGELYKVTPKITIDFNSQNLYPSSRTWGTLYWNNNTYPIIINVRNHVYKTVLASDGGNHLKINNTPVQWNYVGLGYPTYDARVLTFYAIIPPASNYRITNQTNSGTGLVYTLMDWYESQMQIQ